MSLYKIGEIVRIKSISYDKDYIYISSESKFNLSFYENDKVKYLEELQKLDNVREYLKLKNELEDLEVLVVNVYEDTNKYEIASGIIELLVNEKDVEKTYF